MHTGQILKDNILNTGKKWLPALFLFHKTIKAYYPGVQKKYIQWCYLLIIFLKLLHIFCSGLWIAECLICSTDVLNRDRSGFFFFLRLGALLLQSMVRQRTMGKFPGRTSQIVTTVLFFSPCQISVNYCVGLI